MTAQNTCALATRPATDTTGGRQVDDGLQSPICDGKRALLRTIPRAWNGLCPCCGADARLTALSSRRFTCDACGADYAQLELGSAAALFVIPPAFAVAAVAAVLCEEFLALPLMTEMLAAALLGVLSIALLMPRAYGLALALAWSFDVEGAGSALKISVKASPRMEAEPSPDRFDEGIVASR